ncbi:proton-coupled zinc antiporter SLC30A2-like [Ornithodoros turicata]|uniref:proton-coupled zinc antiporter SLC30A2-like n=1 Tax=Ornithodoros turicata TaxID=34597 RepID=UPI00313A0AD4
MRIRRNWQRRGHTILEPRGSMSSINTALLTSPSGWRRYETFVSKGTRIAYRSSQAEPPARPSPERPSSSQTTTLEGPVYESHCHSPSRGEPSVDVSVRRKLIVASVLCLVFMCIEAVGGALAQSLAIATDAAHLLTDFASFMISLFSLWLSTKPATKQMSFGWHRAEVIAAVMSVLLIWVVSGVLLFLSVQRIVLKDYHVNATVMLITAGLGIAFNITMGLLLQAGNIQIIFTRGLYTMFHTNRESSGSSSEDSSEDPPSTCCGVSTRKQNLNVRAAFLHVMGDLLQSLGVLIAALIIYFKPEYSIADPLCTFIFSIIVLLSTLAIMRDGILVLMEGKPNSIDFLEVQHLLANEPGVCQVHNVRIWSLKPEKIALSAHIVIHPKVNGMYVLKNCSRLIRSRFNIFDLSLKVEEYDSRMDDCEQCNDLSNST